MLKNNLLFLTVMIIIQGCVPVIVGGAATTASVIHDRRSAGTIVDDNALELKVKKSILSQPFLANNSHVNVTGYNGMILLTGEAFNKQILQQIEQVAKNTQGVKRVENYLIIGRRSTLGERAFDTTQTTKVKTALFNISLSNFDPTRVKVVTEHGNTYLLGIVSAQEAQAVIEITRRVSEVKKVISLFEIVNSPPLTSSSPTVM